MKYDSVIKTNFNRHFYINLFSGFNLLSLFQIKLWNKTQNEKFREIICLYKKIFDKDSHDCVVLPDETNNRTTKSVS